VKKLSEQESSVAESIESLTSPLTPRRRAESKRMNQRTDRKEEGMENAGKENNRGLSPIVSIVSTIVSIVCAK